ncbi:MAG: MarR family transcriptional regulator [Bdellovibrionota bacterium]
MKIEQYIKRSLLLAIGSSYDSVWRDLNSKLQKEDCNLLQAVILISIFFEPSETVTPSNLAAIFRTTRGNVSHCISHLERKGFVKRQLDQGDARKYRLALKLEGKRAALRLMKTIDSFEDYFEDQLGKQSVSKLIESLHMISELRKGREVTL